MLGRVAIVLLHQRQQHRHESDVDSRTIKSLFLSRQYTEIFISVPSETKYSISIVHIQIQHVNQSSFEKSMPFPTAAATSSQASSAMQQQIIDCDDSSEEPAYSNPVNLDKPSSARGRLAHTLHAPKVRLP